MSATASVSAGVSRNSANDVVILLVAYVPIWKASSCDLERAGFTHTEAIGGGLSLTDQHAHVQRAGPHACALRERDRRVLPSLRGPALGGAAGDAGHRRDRTRAPRSPPRR